MSSALMALLLLMYSLSVAFPRRKVQNGFSSSDLLYMHVLISDAHIW